MLYVVLTEVSEHAAEADFPLPHVTKWRSDSPWTLVRKAL